MNGHYLVTGGAGFIGCNYVARLLSHGKHVTVYDNLSRRGAELNVEWLRNKFGVDSFNLQIGDVCDSSLLAASVKDVDVIVHLAGQVAVTSSVSHPRADFKDNALGTFNVLEAARLSGRNPIVLYASTNKVYGGMETIGVMEADTRYRYKDLPWGVPETQPLDFHSPYGCSKGAGDQYVRDYHRIYGLPTVVLRQSCIYGPRQFGVEDQGWVAWFVIAATLNRPIVIYGDGKQVRDILYIDDLLDFYDIAIEQIGVTAGQIYNVGGGPDNTLSIWREFNPLLERLLRRPISVTKESWRPGDQRVFISDIRRAYQDLDWQPKVGIEQGVHRLVEWVRENQDLFWEFDSK